jgi:hypothetical protein
VKERLNDPSIAGHKLTLFNREPAIKRLLITALQQPLA